jgi:hypothetical protein
VYSWGNVMNVSEDSTVLSSWKDIARYLGKGVRTVQRWERHLGLPVRRPNGAVQKSAVLLYRGDVDAWLATRFSARTIEKSHANPSKSSGSARSSLRESIRTARELRNTNQALTEQITKTVSELAARCQRLTIQGVPEVNLMEYARLDESLITDLKAMPDLLPRQSAHAPDRIA